MRPQEAQKAVEFRPAARASPCGSLGATAIEVAIALRVVLAVVLGGTFAMGCSSAPAPPTTPEATIRAFARALNRAKYDEAYQLMSEAYRKRLSLAEFKKKLSENPDETLAASNALSHIQAGAEQEAVIAYGDDKELRLQRRGERWYLTTSVVDFYDQSTPRAALHSFTEAMRRKRYDVVLRLVPNSDKEGLSAERMEQAWSGDEREQVERMLSNLREHAEDPIEILGDHATMPYGEHLQVQFVREEGLWKIEDPE
jgi:hypothetical protein